eukprot:CAMPEP_0174367440 /NCGR_PEP_ID=MMETSP0811_2-20130205/85316_1 /TAXON_ID=73025 ORGANISM="Eutreptiella gymnastica-like, Strain CCMP1594" /NCGR_SAMPLE_ID=MMETSP0811_2 /ASSEMBLY_ACC=CAM_ASM_000667 /LENGTH=65 /DNA_ID=CAMNT_0015509999 /DNA_START=412 /DNA_END=609 /DNA_ORIENTATION=+
MAVVCPSQPEMFGGLPKALLPASWSLCAGSRSMVFGHLSVVTTSAPPDVFWSQQRLLYPVLAPWL